MRKIYLLVGSISLIIFCQNIVAEEPDWAQYKEVLHHLSVGVKNDVSLMQVDYHTIIKNGVLNKAYQALSIFDVARLSNRNEKLAFYINAYNILALKMVVDHWPTNSIKDIGSFFSPVWNKKAGKLNGQVITLGQIEHKILRPMNEPRIHFAIVCASVSCPDLRKEPYLAKQLDHQLNNQTRHFLNNPGKGLKLGKKHILVSKIFDWFEEDFKSYGGVSSFINRYKDNLPRLKIKTNIPYDWAVNGKQ